VLRSDFSAIEEARFFAKALNLDLSKFGQFLQSTIWSYKPLFSYALYNIPGMYAVSDIAYQIYQTA